MKLFPLFLLMLIGGSQLAVADTSPNQMKLLGKGIEDRRTGEALAFQCVGPSQDSGPNCNFVQLFVFKPDGSVTPISKVFEIRVAAKEVVDASLSQFLGKFGEGFDQYVKKRTEGNRLLKFVAFSGVVILATGLYLNGKVANQATDNIAYAGAALATGSVLIAKNTKALFLSVQVATTAFDNKKGWNWSEQPVSLSHRKFRFLLDYVQQDYQ